MIKDRAAAAAESVARTRSTVENPGSSARAIASGEKAVRFIVFIEIPFGTRYPFSYEFRLNTILSLDL
jgi:hypothetical protein